MEIFFVAGRIAIWNLSLRRTLVHSIINSTVADCGFYALTKHNPIRI
jgi:hypothetical protein